jgi:hypothetical protein
LKGGEVEDINGLEDLKNKKTDNQPAVFPLLGSI